jgi:hypothetical protein
MFPQAATAKARLQPKPVPGNAVYPRRFFRNNEAFRPDDVIITLPMICRRRQYTNSKKCCTKRGQLEKSIKRCLIILGNPVVSRIEYQIPNLFIGLY